MARQVFQHDIIKKIIGVFASIFDEIRFTNGHGNVITVPLGYAPREKWLEDIRQKPDMDEYAIENTYPKMSFELQGMNFAPERHTNPMRRLVDTSGNWTYNRVPYDFTVNLYLATTRINDGNRIIEQILPFFAPELTLTIRDIEELNLETNIQVVLNSVSTVAEYEGSFDDVRILTWEIQFTIKAYLYQDIKASDVIKKTIIDLRSKDYDRIYERLISEVNPRDANRDEPHEIVESIIVPPLSEPPIDPEP